MYTCNKNSTSTAFRVKTFETYLIRKKRIIKEKKILTCLFHDNHCCSIVITLSSKIE